MAVFLYNRTKSASIFGESPYHRLFGQAPNLIGLKTFGCWIYSNMRLHRQSKFFTRSESHVFLGYPWEYLGYICLNPSNGKIIISEGVLCLEEDFDQNPSLSFHQSIVTCQQELQEDVNYPILTKICFDNPVNYYQIVPDSSATLVIRSQDESTNFGQVITSKDSNCLTSKNTSQEDLATVVDDSEFLVGNVEPLTSSAHSMITPSYNSIRKPNLKYMMQIFATSAVPTSITIALANPCGEEQWTTRWRL